MADCTTSVYLEVEFRKESIMNEIVKAGEVFQLAQLILYQAHI